MFNKSEMRLSFERELVKGSEPMQIVPECPSDTKLAWLKRYEKNFEDAATPVLSSVGRRLNGFCLGSDPEFVFVSPGRSNKLAASELGLKPALAAGCDQNQRLAELRCWPTRSAVEHVAGVMASLRWMYRLYPYVRDQYWRAGAFYDGDGIGGHVHFGRKRPTRDQEITGLDGLTAAFRQMNCFNLNDWERRIRGDARNQRYGDYGDYRLQLHGYEYRTLPSWLCSPLKAFFVLAATKLAVMDPDLVSGWRQRVVDSQTAFMLLRRLALFYSGRDDDAWILKSLLSRPTTPRVIETWQMPARDFKLNWGFVNITEGMITPLKSNILAACVAPASSEVQEIADHLLRGTAITYKEVAPTFRNELPTGYYWGYGKNMRGINYAGAGDLAHNLVMHKNFPVEVGLGVGFYIASNLWEGLSSTERATVMQMYPLMRVTRDYSNYLQFERGSCGVEGIKKARRLVLHTGLFPIWTVDSVQKDSWDKWHSKRNPKVKTAAKKAPLERRL